MMPPPIASPHSAEQGVPSKPPFRGLRIFVVVDALCLLLSPLDLIYSANPHKSWALGIGLNVVYSLLWGLLLWRLWHGSGIARAIFLWVNALSLFAALLYRLKLEGIPFWLRALNDASHAFILFGLVWLNLPAVKAHFRPQKSV